MSKSNSINKNLHYHRNRISELKHLGMVPVSVDSPLDIQNLADNAVINCFKSQKSKSEDHRKKPYGDLREVSEKEGQAAQVGRDIPEDYKAREEITFLH